VMIGRGVFSDPFCFRDSDGDFSENGAKKRIELLKYHLDLFDRYGTGSFEPLKKFFKIYVNGFPGAAGVRGRLMECKGVQEVRAILETLEEEKI